MVARVLTHAAAPRRSSFCSCSASHPSSLNMIIEGEAVVARERLEMSKPFLVPPRIILCVPGQPAETKKSHEPRAPFLETLSSLSLLLSLSSLPPARLLQAI